MKVLHALTAILLVKLFMLGSCLANKCSLTNKCKFGGECTDGNCACRQNCDEYGIDLLCGENRKYYPNFCYVMMASCQRQEEIKIYAIGTHGHCESVADTSNQNPSSDEGKRRVFCELKDNHCQNYGICVLGESTHCLCSDEFDGERCQFRKDTDEEKEVSAIRRHSRETIIGQDPKKMIFHEGAILVTFCALSAMCSAIVTSSICYRIRSKKFQKYQPKLIYTKEHNGGNKEKVFDSRTDPNIFQSTKLREYILRTFGKLKNENCVNKILEV